MKLLVTGATGKLGSLVVDALLKTKAATDLAVSVRSPEKAEALRSQGVDVRHGDFDQPETLEKTFAGVDRLLLISTDGDNETRIRQHQTAVQGAKKQASVISLIQVWSTPSITRSLLLRYTARQNKRFVSLASLIRSCVTIGTLKMKLAVYKP